MDMPGASAYGVFNGAMFRSILALIKTWLEGACGGGGNNATASDSQAGASAAAAGGGRKRPAAARGRGRAAAADSTDEDEDDDSEDEVPSSKGSRSRGGGAKKGGASLSSTRGLEALLRALERSLISGSLSSSLRAHDDVQGELTDLVLGTYAMAPASGSLADSTRAVLMALIGLAGGGGGNPIVLRALMPLLTMKASRSGLPTDARTRTGAHQKAVQVRDLRTSLYIVYRQKRAKLMSHPPVFCPRPHTSYIY